ncbi:TonB-dependent receptor plug domain-containing protein [Snodgrassella alvi]|uniref:TonB-dependent receptor plug domain-containing protein n=1 Tax=Snodgrassella alvi TaxID=1196083 RepID=UPI003463E814
MQPVCHTRFLSPVCTVYASLFIMQPVLAKNQSEHNNLNSYALPTIIVIASKPNKDLVNTSILRQPQLDTIQSNNIASLLEYLPGTSMVGSPRLGGQQINIWGLSDPEDVPVTVGGSIKLDTKDASEFLREGENIGALIKYAHASNNIQNNWSDALFAQSITVCSIYWPITPIEILITSNGQMAANFCIQPINSRVV